MTKANTHSVRALACYAGADIKDAIHEAIEASKKANAPIYLIHNFTIHVHPDSTFDEVYAEWQRKA